MSPTLILVLVIGIVGSNSLLLSPIAVDVAASFAQSEGADVMTASAIYGAGTALSALVFAPHADRIGLRQALFLALVVLTIGLGLSVIAQSVTWLSLAQAIAGIGAGVALPATYGLAAEIAPKGRESEVLGRVLTGWTLSLVVGVSVSAVFADIFHWRAVFGVLTVIGLGLIIVLRRMMPAGAGRITIQNVSPFHALKIPGLIPVLLSVSAYMIAFYGLYAFLGTHLKTSLGLSTATIGLASLTYGIGFGIVAPLDKLIDRYGTLRSAPWAFATLMLVYVLIAINAGSGIGIFVFCLLWGAANHLGLNLLVGRLISIDPVQRASIMGLYSAVTYASMFVGTAAFKPVFEGYGFAASAYLAALCILPAALMAIWRIRPNWQPRS